jgi:hypothetical protein
VSLFEHLRIPELGMNLKIMPANFQTLAKAVECASPLALWAGRFSETARLLLSGRSK